MALLGGFFAGHKFETAAAAIVVRPTASDNISVFDSGNGLVDVMAAVTRSRFYRAHERKMLAVSRALIASVPYFWNGPSALAADTDSSQKTSVASVHGSDRFMWIRAHDLFVAHRAHGMPLLSDGSTAIAGESDLRAQSLAHGSAASNSAAAPGLHIRPQYQDTALQPLGSAPKSASAQLARDRITRHMISLEHLSNEHLLWRFRTLFTVPRAIALGGAGLFREVVETFSPSGPKPESPRPGEGREHEQSAAERESDSAPLLSLLSGHDVTLLPLLYGLAAISSAVWGRFPSDPRSWRRLSGPSEARLEVPWPVYTATLAIRLVDASNGSSGEPLLLWTLDNTVPEAGPDSLGAIDPFAASARDDIDELVSQNGDHHAASAESEAQVHGEIMALAAQGPRASAACDAIPHLFDDSACDLDLTVEDAAVSASDGLPSHLAHKLGSLGPKGQLDTVLQLRGAVWLRDVAVLAQRLRDIAEEAQRSVAAEQLASSDAWLRGLRR